MKILALLVLLLPSLVFAAGGYEKPSLWSSRAVSLGGAVASSASRSEALVFNPAGISDREISVHLAYYSGYMTAPLKDNSPTRSTDDPVFAPAFLASYKINNRLAIAFGTYGLAGLDIKYKKVNYGSVDSDLAGYNRDYYGKLAASEYSLGFSYKLFETLKFGASVRGQNIKGSFQETQVLRASGSNTVLGATTATVDNIKDWSFGSYRLGLQFLSPDKKWGLGTSYRSEVKIRATAKNKADLVYTDTGAAAINGMIGAPVYTGGTVYQLNGGNASVGGLLPQRLDVDGHYNLNENNTLFVGYSWTEYKMSKQLSLKGAVTDPITGQVTTLPNAVQNWHNMHEYKIGFETTHFDFATYRLGYTLTSQVTNDNNATAKAATPDQYHHYAVGLTKQITNRLSFDTAFEYYYAVGAGKSEGSDDGVIAVNSVKGNSMTEVYGVFGGLRYQY